MKKIYLLFILFFLSFNTQAEVLLPAIIGNNMVLKRNAMVQLWGWDSVGQEVAIVTSWNPKDTVKVKCDKKARFEVLVSTPEAGGPYSISFKGSTSKTIENVMIGEVWLCGGQSNMEYNWGNSFGTPQNFKKEIKNPNQPDIRIMTVPKKESASPQEDCDSEWVICSETTLPSVSCVSYYFAHRLQETLQIPVGIVVSCWGGTPAEKWIPLEEIERKKLIREDLKHLDPKPHWLTRISTSYNGMITPLSPFSFSGAIWYQGESNVDRAESYDRAMRTLIDSWRSLFNFDLPFYYVQIAPFSYGGPQKNKSAFLREQQTFTREYPKCGMVVINDLITDVHNIHPENKKDVGLRLANMALRETYEYKNIDCNYPEIEKVESKGSELNLTIKNGFNLEILNKEKSNFEIADKKGSFVPAKIKLLPNSNKIILFSESVKEPVYVRYLFDDTSLCNIKGANGLPLLPYRNDNFNE